jgi:YHS domain-containing protein
MKINLLTLLFLIITLTTNAQVDPVNKNGVAIGGYDVVAYFKDNKPVKANSTLKAEFNNITYYFSSIENHKAFLDAPGNYLPEYDGYCALSVTYGKKLSIDPETFRIVNNKLYLFYNGDTSNGKVNFLKPWDKNQEKNINKADALWPEVKNLKYKPVN